MGATPGQTIRPLFVDLALIAALAGLLVGLHWVVPPGIREGFAFSYTDPDPLHAVTAAYVHLTTTHLVGNLVGLVLGGSFGALLAHAADEHRWFRLSVLSYLTVLPIVVGMTAAAAIPQPVVSRGFSAVVAGFAGFALVGVAVVLQRVLGVDRWLAWDVVAALILVVAAEIAWSVTGDLPPTLAGLLVVGLAVTLIPVSRGALRSGLPSDRRAWGRLVGAVAVTGTVLAVVSWFVIGLFPGQLVDDGGVTNILSHYLGLVYGAVIAGWGYRYWSTGASPWNRRS